MARPGGGRMFRSSSFSRLSWKSFYNELDLERARTLNSSCSWSNLTDTRLADRNPRRTLPRSEGPSAKTITRCLAIFPLCDPYDLFMYSLHHPYKILRNLES